MAPLCRWARGYLLGGRCRLVGAGHPWRWGRRKGGALDWWETICFFEPSRINSKWGNDATISSVQWVGGVGGGGVNEDRVEVFEGAEFFCGEVLGHVPL